MRRNLLFNYPYAIILSAIMLITSLLSSCASSVVKIDENSKFCSGYLPLPALKEYGITLETANNIIGQISLGKVDAKYSEKVVKLLNDEVTKEWIVREFECRECNFTDENLRIRCLETKKAAEKLDGDSFKEYLFKQNVIKKDKIISLRDLYYYDDAYLPEFPKSLAMPYDFYPLRTRKEGNNNNTVIWMPETIKRNVEYVLDKEKRFKVEEHVNERGIFFVGKIEYWFLFHLGPSKSEELAVAEDVELYKLYRKLENYNYSVHKVQNTYILIFEPRNILNLDIINRFVILKYGITSNIIEIVYVRKGGTFDDNVWISFRRSLLEEDIKS